MKNRRKFIKSMAATMAGASFSLGTSCATAGDAGTILCTPEIRVSQEANIKTVFIGLGEMGRESVDSFWQHAAGAHAVKKKSEEQLTYDPLTPLKLENDACYVGVLVYAEDDPHVLPAAAVLAGIMEEQGFYAIFAVVQTPEDFEFRRWDDELADISIDAYIGVPETQEVSQNLTDPFRPLYQALQIFFVEDSLYATDISVLRYALTLDHHLIARTRRISLPQIGNDEIESDTDRDDVQTNQAPQTRVANLYTGPAIQISQTDQVLLHTVRRTDQEFPDWMMWHVDDQVEGDEAWLLTLQSG